MNKNSGYSHVLKYTGLFGSAQVLGILCSLVRNKLVATILGLEGMGLITLFNSTLKLMTDSSNLGISMSAVKNISEEFETGQQQRVIQVVQMVRVWSLLAAVFGMLLCMTMSPLLSRFAFSNAQYTWHFVALSPVVAITTIVGGETALLKGVRQLKQLAMVSVFNAVAALLVSIPLYWLFGLSGIIPDIVLFAAVQAVFMLRCSYRLYPLRLSFNRQLMRQGYSMVMLGIAFVATGIISSSAEFVIRSYLNYTSSIADVGLYSAGFTLVISYAGMVFMAMETDYFPRLSAVCNPHQQQPSQVSAMRLTVAQNHTVNTQVEVTILLIAPLTVLCIVALPFLLPLLYSREFLPALGMMQVMMLSLYCRALALPIEYLSLAHGDSRSFLFIETIYNVMLVTFTVLAHQHFSLFGAGVALTLSFFADLLLAIVFMRRKYHYRLSPTAIKYLSIQLPIGLFTYATTLVLHGAVYWLSGIVLIALSTLISLRLLKQTAGFSFASLLKRKG